MESENNFRENNEKKNLSDAEFKAMTRYMSEQANQRGRSIGYFAMLELENEICLSLSATDTKIENMFYTLFNDNDSIRDIAAKVMSTIILERIKDPKTKSDAALKLARDRFKSFLGKEKKRSPEDIARELMNDPSFNIEDYITPVEEKEESFSNTSSDDDINDIDSLLDKLTTAESQDEKKQITDLMDKLNIGTSDEGSKE